MKNCLLKSFIVIAFLMSNAFIALSQNATVITKTGTRFNKVSDNGRYAVGNVGKDYGLVYDIENDILVYLTGSGPEVPQSQANDVTDDGIVFGQYLKQAAYYEIDWEGGFAAPNVLELPGEHIEGDESSAKSVTPDGKYAGGERLRLANEVGYDGVPLRWNLTTGAVEVLDIDKPNSVYMGSMWHITPDGQSGVGRLMYLHPAMTKFGLGIWNSEGNLEKVMPEIFSDENFDMMSVSFGGMRSDISEIVGIYEREEDNKLVTFPFIYDVKGKTIKKLETNIGTHFIATSDAGVILGVTGSGGFPFSGTAQVYENDKLYNLSDWLVEFYQCNGYNEIHSGVACSITPDGRTIVGSGYVGNMVPTAFVIKLGDKKVCPKVSAFNVDVIGNETVSVSWVAPTESYVSAVKGYNVYRDGILINKSMITETTFAESLQAGQYSYAVEVIYEDGCSSGKTDPKYAEIYYNGSCYPPSELGGWSSAANGYIRLEWEYPAFDLKYNNTAEPYKATAWGDGSEVLPFFFGTKWTEQQIRDMNLDGTAIESVSFYINAKADYEIVIFKNPETHNPLVYPVIGDMGSVEIYRQAISNADMEAGYDRYSTFKLDTPVIIDVNNKNYYITILCKNFVLGTYPATHDKSVRAKEWQTDLIAAEPAAGTGVVWYSLKALVSASDNNWILSAKVTPKDVEGVSPAVPGVPSIYDPLVAGYSIFRNGEEIGKSETNTFSDFSAGKDDIDYSYTVKANYKYNCISEASNEVVLNPTSVDGLEVDFRIYPNPVTNGVINIDANYKALTITDIQGRVVLHVYEGGSSVDVSTLRRGVYFLKVNIDGVDVMKKIMIK